MTEKKNLSKYCIFCGERPVDKNREHVIPLWLIKLTGDASRQIQLGLQWGNEKLPKTFAFNKFVMPACTRCNDEFSQLEFETKPIIIKLLNKVQITVNEADRLLDWLDKIRIGLWLAGNYFVREHVDVMPKFHIRSRMGEKDRMAAIYRIGNSPKGLNFYGANSPIFQRYPCAFVLRINDLFFFNASKDFLLSARLGFPYFESVVLAKPDYALLSGTLNPGNRFSKFPIMRKPLVPTILEIYQPMISYQFSQKKYEYYGTEYIKSNCLDWDRGHGAIFVHQNGKSVAYANPTTILEYSISKNSNSEFESLYKDVLRQVFDLYDTFIDSDPPLETPSEEEAINRKDALKKMKKLNKLWIKKIDSM